MVLLLKCLCWQLFYLNTLKILFSCLLDSLVTLGKSTVIFVVFPCSVVHPFFLAALSTFSLYLLFFNFITVCLEWSCFSFSYLEYLGLPGSVDSYYLSVIIHLKKWYLKIIPPLIVFILFLETETCMINLLFSVHISNFSFIFPIFVCNVAFFDIYLMFHWFFLSVILNLLFNSILWFKKIKFHSCYCLNVCVPLKFIYWNPNPQRWLC